MFLVYYQTQQQFGEPPNLQWESEVLGRVGPLEDCALTSQCGYLLAVQDQIKAFECPLLIIQMILDSKRLVSFASQMEVYLSFKYSSLLIKNLVSLS